MWDYHKLRTLRELLLAHQEGLRAISACQPPPCRVDDTIHPAENLRSHLVVGILSDEERSLADVESALQRILDLRKLTPPNKHPNSLP
jgi:hypothetical protein